MILFLISNMEKNSGYGGHYYSLMHIAEEVSKKQPVKIINIGITKAPALKIWKGDIYYLETSQLTNSEIIKNILDLCDSSKASILHSFDLHSAFFATKVSMVNGISCVCTKPGGPVPYRRLGKLGRWLYPVAPVQTVFHEADYNWFQKQNRLNVIEMVRGRVRKPEQNENRSPAVADYLNDVELKLIRIARISEDHFLSIKQAIFFTQLLRKNNISAKLAVIGNINSKSIFKKLISLAKNETVFFTSKEFVTKASDFIADCNIIIGSGRSFMEGCAMGRVMMAPVFDTKYPALVTLKNIRCFEKENFSNRVRAGMWGNPDADCKKYIDIISDPNQRKRLCREMVGIFQERYDARKGAEDYLRIYHNIIKANIFKFDYINFNRKRFVLNYWIRMAYFKVTNF